MELAGPTLETSCHWDTRIGLLWPSSFELYVVVVSSAVSFLAKHK